MSASTLADAGAASELPKIPNPFFLMDWGIHNYREHSTGFHMRTLLEKQLDTFTHAIRQKPQWWIQVHSDEAVQKWGMQAAQEGVADDVFAFGIKAGIYMVQSRPTWKHVQQLRNLSTQCTADGVRPSPVSVVYESEAALEGGLRESILAALRPLEEVPEDEKDWRPGSAKQVLELVDPCLFPLVQGLSRAITLGSCHSGQPEAIQPHFRNWKTCMGSGSTVEELVVEGEPVFVSKRFQWLPTDVAVDVDGGVKFLSYINNMHPKRHSQLYACTARLLERFIPLFERVLATAAAEKPRAISAPIDNGVTCEGSSYDDWEANKIATDENINNREDAFAAWSALLQNEEALKEQCFIAPTIPEEFVAPPVPPAVSLRGRTVQVIVRYACIVLTPEQPRYEGGVWDVEGMKNECIVASCTACLRNENIIHPRLAFRSMVDEPDVMHHYDYYGPKFTYGLRRMDSLNDDLGAVQCSEGRVVACPNTLQRSIQPFELEDRSRKGICTFAVLHLIDPSRRITSTGDVPPQQRSWHNDASGISTVLSAEVMDVIDAKRDFPVSLARAKSLREELMHERAYVTEMGNAPPLDVDESKAWDDYDYDEEYEGYGWFHRKFCFFP